MTTDKVREVANKYRIFLNLFKSPSASIEKCDIYDRCIKDSEKARKHIHYMTYEIDNLLAENRLEKSFRWLGFIQGCLFCLGLRSLDDLKNDSRKTENPNQFWFNFD